MEVLSILSSSSMLDQISDNLLGLPRELRDQIYANVATLDQPISLTETAIFINVTNAIIQEEPREAIYTHNTLAITFSGLQGGRLCPSSWGAHSRYKKHVRRLEVYAPEAQLHETELQALERECTVSQPEMRKEWTELLKLPHLKSLAINLYKQHPTRFTWANFSPIVYDLRASRKDFNVRFNVCFDRLLEPRWNSESYQLAAVPGMPEPYEHMRFVDVSDLLERPSEEDNLYVAEHLEKKMEIKGRDAFAGLLWQSAKEKRILAKHYVVKEPALLRVLMEEHYGVYKQERDLKSNVTVCT